MAANIAEIRAAVVGQDGTGGRVKDASHRLSLVPAMTCDVDVAILAAVGEYEKSRPFEATVIVDGTGNFDYSIASTFPDFVDGSSVIRSIQYPWLSTYPYIDPVHRDYYRVTRMPAAQGGLVLRWTGLRPPIGQQFLVTHTARHTVNASTCTVWPGDDEAVKDLAAAHCCDALAGFYNQVVDSSIGADTTDRRALADMYRSQATRWRNSFALKLPKTAVPTTLEMVRV